MEDQTNSAINYIDNITNLINAPVYITGDTGIVDL